MKPKIITFSCFAAIFAPTCYATIISATQNGAIFDPLTWGSVTSAPPVAGNIDTWKTEQTAVYFDASGFQGNLFVLNAGSILQSGPVNVTGPGEDPTFQNFTFDGGTIFYARNLNCTFSFGTKKVNITALGGRVESDLGTGDRDVWFSGGKWMGSGELVFSNLTASDNISNSSVSTFRLTAGANLSGFTGTFSAINKAVLEIDVPVTTPTFALQLSEGARYDNINDSDIVVRSLVIAGTSLPPGQYRVGNGTLTPSQEACILTTGAITVSGPTTLWAFPDTNNNGSHDFEEIKNPGVNFNAPQFTNRNLDSDSDGQTDFHEFIAKTNPTSQVSYIACKVLQTTSTDVTLGFFGNAGVRYQLQWTPNLIGWASFGAPQVGANSDTTVTMPFATLGVADPKKLFFRMAVLGSDNFTPFVDNGTDTDADGLKSTVENATLMFNASTADSMRSTSDGGDAKHMRELLRGVNLSESLTDTTYANSISPESAARFLFQAGFGPRDSDIIAVQNLGYEGWINSQLTKPIYSSYETYMRDIESQWAALRQADPNGNPDVNDVPFETQAPGFPQNNLSTAFMRGLLHGDDVLRQKSVWALLQIIVASGAGYTPRYGLPCSVYIDIFHNQCFSRYEDLLYAVSTNGHMGDWLSFINNKKENPALKLFPDENYAREIMQLFTIGLYEMNLDGSLKKDSSGGLITTYDFDDVATLAKTFTGLKGATDNGTAIDTVNWNFTSREMVAKETDHDKTAKSLLNGYIQIPANMTVKNEVRLVCQKLVQHPNCAPFVATRLIQNLVTSNPTPAYVARISKIFKDSDGNLGQVIKGILLDPEARGPRFLVDPIHGKLREPLIRFASLARAFEVAAEVDSSPYTNDNLMFTQGKSLSTQAFFDSPSVFNFFQSGYQESGEIQDANLTSPEFQLLSAPTNLSFIEEVRTKLVGYLHTPKYILNPSAAIPSEPAVRFRMSKEVSLLNNPADRDKLVDRLSLLVTGGLADREARSDFKQPIFATGTYTSNWATETSENRLKYALLKLFSDSSCAIQR